MAHFAAAPGGGEGPQPPAPRERIAKPQGADARRVAYRIETARLVLRCYSPADAPARKAAVDASRDLRALREAADRRGLRVAYAADTHLHADFLSGAVQLAAKDGAKVLASSAGGRDFPHTGLGDGDEVDLGGLTLRAVATPGHTHEHIAFELLDGPRTVCVFTGGSLIVG